MLAGDPACLGALPIIFSHRLHLRRPVCWSGRGAPCQGCQERRRWPCCALPPDDSMRSPRTTHPLADSGWASSSGAPIARVLGKEIDEYGGDLDDMFSDLFRNRARSLASPAHGIRCVPEDRSLAGVVKAPSTPDVAEDAPRCLTRKDRAQTRRTRRGLTMQYNSKRGRRGVEGRTWRCPAATVCLSTLEQQTPHRLGD
jgi:hypothetical protein